MNAYSVTTNTTNTANTAAVTRTTIEREIREAYVGFDETALMLFNDSAANRDVNVRQQRFFRQVDEATRNYHRRVWISIDTLKLMEQEAAAGKGSRSAVAGNALNFVRKLHETNRLQIVEHQSFSDTLNSGDELETICRTMRDQSAERLTVFTQRATVADALMAINREEKLSEDRRINVFRVTINGYLGTFLTPDARAVAPRCEQYESRWTEEGYEVLTRPRPTTQAANARFGPNAVPATQPEQRNSVTPMHRFQIQAVRSEVPAQTAVEPMEHARQATAEQPAPRTWYQPQAEAAERVQCVSENQERRNMPEQSASLACGRLTQLSNDAIPLHYAPTKRARTLGTGSELRGDTGATYVVGEAISCGAESSIYRVAGSEALCVKLYARPTRRKQVKARLLMGAMLDGLLTPADLVYTTSGSFCGYVMPLVQDAVRLSDAFSPEWRAANGHLLSWQRDSFVQAALRVAELHRALYERGVCYTDASADNVLIPRNACGQYNPAGILLCDADSCQIDSRKLSGGMFDYGVLPGDKVCADMLAPELHTPAFSAATLLSEANMTYHTALLAFQACMAGVHAFTAEGSTARSYAEAICKGEFAFSSFGQAPSGLMVPDVAEHLFSNTPTGFKTLMYDVFSPRGKMNALDKRPSFDVLLTQLRHYAEWIGNPANEVKAPEYRSLAPAANKPYQKYCSTPGCVHNHRFAPVASSPEALRPGMVIRVGQEYYCYNCYHAMQAARRAYPVQNSWYLQTGC